MPVKVLQSVQGGVTENIYIHSKDADLDEFTAVSRGVGASALNPVQTLQPESDDTLTTVCVDPSGNVVRGSQEATWKLDRAALNALTNNKVVLLNPPSSGQCIVVEDSHWLIEIDTDKAGEQTPMSLICEIVNGQSIYKVATQITWQNLSNIAGHVKSNHDDAIAAGEPSNGNFALYSRDVPQLDRISRFNEPMTIRAKDSGLYWNGHNFGENFISVTLKIKYRVFDKDTF